MILHTCSTHNYTGTEECPDCIKESITFSEKDVIKYIKDKFDIFTANQKDVPSEYIDIINKNFWDLINQ